MNIKVTDLTYHRQQRLLDVSFNDTSQCQLSAEFLRVYSPSAEVLGHSPAQAKLVANKKMVAIKQLEPIGNYAIRIHFDDGHNSGLYSWSYLHQLSRDQPTLWQQYLTKLKGANATRDPVIAIALK